MIASVRLQFRLLWFVLVIGVVAFLFSMVGHEFAFRSQTRQLAELPSARVVVKATQFDYQSRFTRWRVFLHRLCGSEVIVGLSLRFHDVDDLTVLKNYRYLRYVELSAATGTDQEQHLQNIAQIESLRVLKLNNFKISDFASLSGLSNLDTLDVQACESDNWSSVKRLQNLEILMVPGPDRDYSNASRTRNIEIWRQVGPLLPNCEVVRTRISSGFLAGVMHGDRWAQRDSRFGDERW